MLGGVNEAQVEARGHTYQILDYLLLHLALVDDLGGRQVGRRVAHQGGTEDARQIRCRHLALGRLADALHVQHEVGERVAIRLGQVANCVLQALHSLRLVLNIFTK